MSTLILSLLLLLLIAAGLLMAKPIHEHFTSSPAPSVIASPSLVNMLVTPNLSESVQPDFIQRGLDEQSSWKHVATNKRADCRNVGEYYEDDIAGCKAKCAADKKCNLINYDDDAGPSCLTQSCKNLNDIPYDSNTFPGSEVWAYMTTASGSLVPAASGSLAPAASGSMASGSMASGSMAPANCPKQKECPDMSQYIRLDEIPCWNCSLP